MRGTRDRKRWSAIASNLCGGAPHRARMHRPPLCGGAHKTSIPTEYGRRPDRVRNSAVEFLPTASCGSRAVAAAVRIRSGGCRQIAGVAMPIRTRCTTNSLLDLRNRPAGLQSCPRRACSEYRWEPLHRVLQRTEHATGRAHHQAPVRGSASARPARGPTMHAHDPVTRCGRACARFGRPDRGRERIRECLLPHAIDAAWQLWPNRGLRILTAGAIADRRAS